MTTIDLLNQWLAADAEVSRLEAISEPAWKATQEAIDARDPIEEQLADSLFGPVKSREAGHSDGPATRHLSFAGKIIAVKRGAFGGDVSVKVIDVEQVNPAEPTS